MVFSRGARERHSQLRTTMQNSFNHVRKDTDTLFAWVKYLKQSHESLQNQSNNHHKYITHLGQRHRVHTNRHDRLMADMRKLRSKVVHRNELKPAIDEHVGDVYVQKVRAIDVRVKRLELYLLRRLEALQQQAAAKRAPQPILTPTLPPKVRLTPLQQKLVSNVGRVSKDYLKKTVRDLLEKYDRLTGTAMREMIVDEQKLCSRSAFYRILDALRAENSVHVISSGKEKIFSLK
jgi:hypothetical protein